MHAFLLKRKTLYFTVLILVLFFNLFPSYAGVAKNSIKVGFFELEGFNDIDENGNLGGYGYEYLMEISKYTSWYYDFISFTEDSNGKHRLTYDEALKLLENGEIDIMGNIPETPILRDLYSYPTSSYATNYGCLSTASFNSKYICSDYSSLNGTTIGIIKGSSRNNEIDNFLKANKVKNYTFKTYDTTFALKDALLKSQEVDLLYSNNFRSMNNECIITKLNPLPYFFVMSKNNEDNVKLLSSALEQIERNCPLFSKQLLTKYYEDSFKTYLALTPKELEYIKANPIVNVAYDPHFEPLEYYDTKQKKVSGVTTDLLDIISKKTNIKFTYVPCTSYGSSLQNTKKNQINVITTFGADYNWATKYNSRLTTPYISLPVSAICNKNVKDLTDSNLTVAVVNGYYLTEKIKNEKNYINYLYYDTIEDCINSISNNIADITFLSTYSADYFLSHPRYSKLRMFTTYDLNYDLSLAITNTSDNLLYSIINKTLLNIPKSSIDEIFYNNILFYKTNNNLSDFIFANPFEFIAIGSLFGAILIAWIIVLKNAKRNVKQEKYLNDERLNLALMHTNTYVFDYDFVTKRLIQSAGSKKIFGEKQIICGFPESLSTSNYIHEDSKESFYQLFSSIKGTESIVSGIFKILPAKNSNYPSEKYIWMRITLTKIFDTNGKPLRSVGVSEDVTQEMSFKEKATKDPLTNLLNRTIFRQATVQYLTEHANDESGAMFLIDIDDFKLVNDQHGHCSGDELLLDVAKTLSSQFRSEDLICRLGGDEFTVFMKNVTTSSEVTKKAKMLSQALIFNSDKFTSTCSIGVVLKKVNSTYEDLYWQADCAMYQAKKKGKNQWFLPS